MSTDRVMLDIETLGLEPGAVILSIGAVRFDTDGLGSEFHGNIDLVSCEDAGLTVDADTLQWWLDQDGEVQHVLTGGEALEDVLEDFGGWYGDAEEVWANSPSFDCRLLEAAYDAVGLESPWNFWSERDFRTLKELPVAAEIEQDGNEHDALDDAKHQARVASDTLSWLEEWSQ